MVYCIDPYTPYRIYIGLIITLGKCTNVLSYRQVQYLSTVIYLLIILLSRTLIWPALRLSGISRSPPPFRYVLTASGRCNSDWPRSPWSSALSTNHRQCWLPVSFEFPREFVEITSESPPNMCRPPHMSPIGGPRLESCSETHRA